jgi:hypothetical protein
MRLTPMMGGVEQLSDASHDDILLFIVNSVYETPCPMQFAPHWCTKWLLRIVLVR